MHNVNWLIMSIHLNNRPARPNFKPMTIRSPDGIAARPVRTAAKVMVAVIAGPDTPLIATSDELRRWRALTPLASWSTISVRGANPDEISQGVAAELARQHAKAHRLILLAEGKAARAALELVLQGALDCAGILAIALPAAALPFRIIPTAAAVRLSCGARSARTCRPISSRRCAPPISMRGSSASIRPRHVTRAR